ncbi:patatin-like phospholipase family protein [Marinobacter sp. SS21]|uniref:patatin-like phospholipase family protein n=1 Tax=Marinobacter sp. SS21 TaxID=2979460 RepID=UPI00232BA4DF|nr:patatin-like phospholipase family protein [Marinobacter sp. SS21]MDC0664115.1 patatin-like phospholipase family protein [Marinobacter sp. SS21]
MSGKNPQFELESGPGFTRDFREVQRQERAWLRTRRQATGDVPDDAPVVGLALSGGGIRSATFNLGVLQALARAGLLHRVDYLSSVSGGGYIAACLSWLRAHVPARAQRDVGGAPLANGQGSVLDWLRAHGNYLINGKGVSGWTLGASILAGTLLNLLVLLPLLIGAVALASTNWWPTAWPTWLHLPGAQAIVGHDGFMLLLLIGAGALVLYLMTLLLFAVATSSEFFLQRLPEHRIRSLMGQCLAVGVMALGLGLLPVFTGLEETALHYFDHQGVATLTRQFTYLLPIASGVLSLRAARSRGEALAAVGLSLVIYGLLTLLYHLCAHTPLPSSPGFYLWLGLSLVLALICNVNTLSLHSFYRGRLANAYLPVVADVARADRRKGRSTKPLNFRLVDIRAEAGGPLHLINTTLNTASSRQQKLRSRGGDSMVLSPLFCGSSATGYRRTEDYLDGELTLSTAFSVSGAALDPNTYATRSRAISFLMTLINARLGFWTRNPDSAHQRRWLPSWYRFMLREMFGIGLAETQSDIHLSDGGHFENLGLYELVRRQCRYIVVCDAAADPGTTLSDLGRAMQRVRADFGAEIELCADALARVNDEGMAERAYATGKVRYADGSEGDILYLRAALCPSLSADIYAYWRTNPSFPDQSTVDQFFDEMQFDSYRQLGLELMAKLLVQQPDSFETLFRQLAPVGAPASTESA